MKKLTIALLSGGKSSEREVSLKGGAKVFEALDKQRYTVLRYDPRDDLPRLIADAPRIDAALIIMHGPYGEDGTIQGLLDLLNIPYQGAGVLGSALAMNKLAAKQLYEKSEIPVPPHMVFTKGDPIVPADIAMKLGLPLVVKPVVGGSSIGMSIVQEESQIPDACKRAFEWDEAAMIETFIDGLELTGSVIGNQTLTALPIVEIIPGKGYDFFNYEAKYTPGATQEICPARLDPDITEKAQRLAIRAHRALFCRDYSRTDMILKDRDIYVLETNTIPGMTPTSLLPLAAQASGISFSQLLDKLIHLCLNRRFP